MQRNPKAGLYAGFADFALYRLRIEDVHFNGGFGRAAPLTPAEVLASREGEAALAEAEERLLAEVNALGAGRARAARGAQAPVPPGWRAIGLDAEGLDLAAGGRAARAQFADAGARPGGLAGASRTAARGRLGARPRRSARLNANKRQ